jgi:hypothetical protein
MTSALCTASIPINNPYEALIHSMKSEPLLGKIPTCCKVQRSG